MIIEIIGGLFLLVIFYYWLVRKEKKKHKKILESYNESDDKSKQGERRRDFEKGFPAVANPEQDTPGLSEPARQELLPTTDVVHDGKTSNSNGEPSGIADFFKTLEEK